jgi:hypothetical protein
MNTNSRTAAVRPVANVDDKDIIQNKNQNLNNEQNFSNKNKSSCNSCDSRDGLKKAACNDASCACKSGGQCGSKQCSTGQCS